MDFKKYNLYLRAFRNSTTKYIEGDKSRDNIKRIVFYGVRTIINKPKPNNRLNEVKENFESVCIVKDLMSLLTPKEFMNVFPVTKEYDGYKHEWKDYSYTMRYMETLNPNKPIGEEILNLLWEYQNWDVTFFNLKLTGCLDDMRALKGQQSVIEEFFAEMKEQQDCNKGNIKGMPSYLKVIK